MTVNLEFLIAIVHTGSERCNLPASIAQNIFSTLHLRVQQFYFARSVQMRSDFEMQTQDHRGMTELCECSNLIYPLRITRVFHPIDWKLGPMSDDPDFSQIVYIKFGRTLNL